jgi:hypothetical protein
MTKKKHLARLALQAASQTLSEEIWEHKWDYVLTKDKPLIEYVEIIQELERRCPGFSKEEYQDSIFRSMLRH